MQTRRDFLGSLIGTAAALPFYARRVTEPPQFGDVRTGLILRSGGIIQGTGIRSIEDGRLVRFNEFLPNRQMEFAGAALLDERGKLVSVAPFERHVYLIPGDTLNVVFQCNGLDWTAFLSQIRRIDATGNYGPDWPPILRQSGTT